ncbi:hypothetical protein GQ43DRAFT_476694 [Delitschia confertaspora ATCC 74209]|uniref:Emopamil binding protein n=1 Tax=Delitschia confertaspora ATCC 74209 TaxID=1513339 RepID=A0A9P4JGD8_9PLEO|nr:hypothetical protein GQ43DRAFT_476694 [Delitschia confertaspora ATCC 74209]
MVSTRHHPSEFPPPDTSPSKSSPRKRTSTASPAPGTSMSSSMPSLSRRAVSNTFHSSSNPDSTDSITAAPFPLSPTSPTSWSHTTSNPTLLWLTISIPLVIWDALYILLRPHTFHNGRLQWPLWVPYEIYAKTDLVYSPEKWAAGEGFGGAQGVMNVVEVVLYGLYWGIVWRHGVGSERGRGVQVGDGAGGGARGGAGVAKWLKGGRRIEGWRGGRAVVIGFAAAVITLSKTMLYYLNEYYSGFENIKHNSWPVLIGLYGIMNGLWILFPAYMTYVFGAEIIEGLDIAANVSKRI